MTREQQQFIDLLSSNIEAQRQLTTQFNDFKIEMLTTIGDLKARIAAIDAKTRTYLRIILGIFAVLSTPNLAFIYQLFQ